jgi:tetratricopeptide (TPR) repeat protein
MKACFLLLALASALFAPSLLRAQPSKPLFGSAQTASTSENRGPNADKMYEDIEIFRRILDRKLNAYYPLIAFEGIGGGMGGMQGGMMGMQNNMMSGIQDGWMVAQPQRWFTSRDAAHSLEGVYLEGQGIIYTATLGSLQPRGKAETTPPPPVDEWESIRRQIRREKDEPPKTEASKPLELSEVLLKLLADHGRHFSQLKENESLIIILTVRDDGTTERVKKLTKKTEPSAAARQAQELETVGDLHFKQGQYDAAISAFHKALELDPESKREAALHRRMAQCYLAQEQYEKGKAELDKAVALLKKGKEDKEKSAAPSVALPEKVIITVPKRLLDFATTNKLSLEEFRNKASVRKFTFGERRP